MHASNVGQHWFWCTINCWHSPGACFSKVPKLFGRISGDTILFVSSKRRRLEARNFAVILIFIPFTTYEKTSFTEKAGRSFTNGFSGPKSSRDFEKQAPGPVFLDLNTFGHIFLATAKLNQTFSLMIIIHHIFWKNFAIFGCTKPPIRQQNVL